MRFLLALLMAMAGMCISKGHANMEGPSITRERSTAFDDGHLGNTVADTVYTSPELTAENLAQIALSVKNHLERPIYNSTRPARKTVFFPELQREFDISGKLSFFRPDSPSEVRPHFVLYSNKDERKSRDNFPLFETSLDEVGFEVLGSLLEPGQKLYIIVHGLKSSASESWVIAMKDEILKKEPYVSVVLVDWSRGCDSVMLYPKAAGNTRTVAGSVAFLVKTLSDAGVISPRNVHYIGHSLGAQAGGFFGQDVKNLTGQLVGRITGLDPAAPLFEDLGVHLRPEHAEFVDVLHTSYGNIWRLWDIVQGGLGMKSSCGHVDFYPNGGRAMPGCKLFTACSHSKAVWYYIDSIRRCHYPTRACVSYFHFRWGGCNPNCLSSRKCGHMGHPARTPMKGDHYTDTVRTPCRQDPRPSSLELAVTRRPSDREDPLPEYLTPQMVENLLQGATIEQRRTALDGLQQFGSQSEFGVVPLRD